MQYFHDCKTVEEVKRLFRKLAMKYHPDRGGDTATMQELNRQYQIALKHCDGQTSTGTDGKEHTYKYDEAAETEIAEKMVTGRLKKFVNEITLLGQPFVKDPDQSVGKLLKQNGATVTTFTRYEVGEGIEKKQDNFAEEVMAQARSAGGA